jgi:hypothetical protein
MMTGFPSGNAGLMFLKQRLICCFSAEISYNSRFFAARAEIDRPDGQNRGCIWPGIDGWEMRPDITRGKIIIAERNKRIL